MTDCITVEITRLLKIACTDNQVTSKMKGCTLQEHPDMGICEDDKRASTGRGGAERKAADKLLTFTH